MTLFIIEDWCIYLRFTTTPYSIMYYCSTVFVSLLIHTVVVVASTWYVLIFSLPEFVGSSLLKIYTSMS